MAVCTISNQDINNINYVNKDLKISITPYERLKLIDFLKDFVPIGKIIFNELIAEIYNPKRLEKISRDYDIPFFDLMEMYRKN